MELAINPSRIISSFCYSILRLEPYGSCSFGCAYCYARWYRKEAEKGRTIGMFAKVARKLKRAGIRLAFRLATLSDPLQDAEESAKISLKLMRIAEENDTPIILCTKSDRIARQPWKGQIERMARDDLIVVQVSVSSLEQNLEPFAPEPAKRLEALAAVDAPRVLRLQPLIPEFVDIAEIVDIAADSCVDQITTEMLRVEVSELHRYGWNEWSFYSAEGGLLKVEAPEMLENLSKACRRRGIDFGLCKEGLFHLETANCCGMHFTAAELRPTLREVWRICVGRALPLDGIAEGLKSYLFGEALAELPNPARKAFRAHERRLISVLKRCEFENLTPLLRCEDGFVFGKVLSSSYLAETC